MARKFVQIPFYLAKYVKIITIWKLMVTDLVCLDRKLIYRKSLWSSLVIKNILWTTIASLWGSTCEFSSLAFWTSIKGHSHGQVSVIVQHVWLWKPLTVLGCSSLGLEQGIYMIQTNWIGLALFLVVVWILVIFAHINGQMVTMGNGSHHCLAAVVA